MILVSIFSIDSSICIYFEKTTSLCWGQQEHTCKKDNNNNNESSYPLANCCMLASNTVVLVMGQPIHPPHHPTLMGEEGMKLQKRKGQNDVPQLRRLAWKSRHSPSQKRQILLCTSYIMKVKIVLVVWLKCISWLLLLVFYWTILVVHQLLCNWCIQVLFLKNIVRIKYKHMLIKHGLLTGCNYINHKLEVSKLIKIYFSVVLTCLHRLPHPHKKKKNTY